MFLSRTPYHPNQYITITGTKLAFSFSSYSLASLDLHRQPFHPLLVSFQVTSSFFLLFLSLPPSFLFCHHLLILPLPPFPPALLFYLPLPPLSPPPPSLIHSGVPIVRTLVPTIHTESGTDCAP